MNLFIIRHTNAHIERADFDRQISSAGKEKLIDKIKILKNHFQKIDLIFSSPFIRAVQSAEIIAEHFSINERIQIEQCLKPGCNPSDLEVLLGIYDFKNVVIVGHEPDCTHLTNYFCKNSPNNLFFEPAQIAQVFYEEKPVRGNCNFIQLI